MQILFVVLYETVIHTENTLRERREAVFILGSLSLSLFNLVLY